MEVMQICSRDQVVKNAGEKGLGAFAKRIIRQGEFIGEFAGEVVRQSPLLHLSERQGVP